MLMPFTLDGLLELASAATQGGSPSIPFMDGALLKLINSSSVTLNAGTQWGSVSPYIGGYAGYTDETITWTPPYTPSAGGVGVLSSLATFRPTGSASGTVNGYGLVLTDSGSSSVMAAGPFDVSPLPFNGTLDQLVCNLIFNPSTATLLVDYTS
jgi:hypothetical protein